MVVERSHTNPLRLILADDHALVRAAFRALLETLDGLEIVAEAADGQEAVKLIETHQPDVVLMDANMPLLNGLDATAQVAKKWPQVRVLIVSMIADDKTVLRALRVGAAGYVLKDVTTIELELAIRAVARGHTYLSPAVATPVVANLRQQDDVAEERAGEEPAASLDCLSSRHREVLQLIAEGHSTKEIAAQLHLSVKTIETRRLQLRKRLDIHNVAGLVRYAVRRGLVSTDR